MNNKLCSVLINSCDKYRTAWAPFFILFNKYFNDCPFPVYLNTEKEKCSFSNVITLNNDCVFWSDRLKMCLDAINSKYVILLLDDFFIQKKVDLNFVMDSIKVMENDNRINCIYFKKITTNIIGQYNSMLSIMDPSKKYILNFQACIWNREELIKLLPSSSNAWQVEDVVLPEEERLFLCMNKGSFVKLKNDVFNYLWSIKSGYGICKSKWLWNNYKLFDKENIIVNYYELGMLSKKQYYCSLLQKHFAKRKKEEK